jgi:hypothetical protein
MAGGDAPRAADRFRVALTFDVEHHDRPATADATEAMLGLLAGLGLRPARSRPPAISSATTPTTMPGCRCSPTPAWSRT